MTADPRLGTDDVERLLAGVEQADAEARRAWPGTPQTRQPVQVYYVSADRVGGSTVADAGAVAARLLDAHAGDGPTLLAACGIDGLPDDVADRVRDRVGAKLADQPLEDLRVDFEDGYLGRDQATEAADATRTGGAVAELLARDDAPPFVGLRVKSFTDGLARRSVATLDRFLAALLDGTGGALPAGFAVTFPKIVAVAHVAAFVDVLDALETAYGLAAGSLRFEAQIETTPSVLGPDGRVALRDLRDAGAGRMCAAHVGVYDYSAGLGLPPAEQRLDHPALDAARHLLQISFAGSEVRLSDGSTNAVPADDGEAEVRRVWQRHSGDVRHSLRHGFVQGWDLHPSHLVSRYTTVYADLLRDLDDVLDRLAAWHGGSSAAGVMDEPATVRAMLHQVQRAVDCGAIDPSEVARRIGATVEPRPAVR
ncbi:MAG: aldolase [Actinobacteria bacterium]|nr:aldolase [Actinomycetota bacterium]